MGLVNVFAIWFDHIGHHYPWANHHVVFEMDCVKKILVAGAGITELTFPYTPTGEKLVDHQALFKKQLIDYVKELEKNG